MADGVVCRKFFLTIGSASDLPDVREVFPTRAYAKVLIGSDDKQIESRTTVDKHNGLNPRWSHDMVYDVAESGVLYYGLSVVIKVYCQRTLGDRLIGEVHTRMKDLFDSAVALGGHRQASLPITTNGLEETGGVLHIYYSFGKSFTVDEREFMERVDKSGVRVFALEATKALVLAATQAIVAVLAG